MVATRLKYVLGTGTHYLDLSKDLSEYHRKLHRQKKIYTVYGGFMRNNAGTSAKFNVAPLTWQTKSAVNRGFRMWKKMVSQILQKHDGAQSGKWNDFKIYLDAGASTPANAVDANGARMSDGQWDYSTMTQPQLINVAGDPNVVAFDKDADQWEMHIVGPHNGAAPNYVRVGLVKSWTDSRPAATPSTGDPVNIPNTNDPLSNLFEVEDNGQEKMDILQAEGDFPPYDRSNPYGNATGSLAPVAIADNDASANTTALGSQIVGFQALCGLVQVVVNADSGSAEIFIDVESEGESF